MPSETLVPEPPRGYMPAQLNNGEVIYLTPNTIVAKSSEDRNRKRRFFEEWNAAVGQGRTSTPQPYGKRGTLFTSGIEAYANVNAGALEKPRDTPNFAFLRAMRKQSMIDQLIINIRLMQMRHVSRRSMNPRRQSGWRVLHKNADDPTFENTDDIQRRCLEMENFVSTKYNAQWHLGGFRAILLNMVEDELTIDRKFMVYDGIDRRGRPTGFHLVDGATVLPRLDAIYPEIDRMAVERRWSAVQVLANPSLVQEASERLSDQFGFDMTNAAYVQILEGRVVAAWTMDECCLDMINTSTEINRWGYALSALESSMWWSLAFMLAANYNKDLFEQNYPEAIMFLFGDYDTEGLEAFKKQVLGEAAAGNNFRLPVIPGGDPSTMQAKVEKIRDTPKDMMFTQWLKMLSSYKCACYRMNPELINMDLVHGSDQTLFQSETGEARVTLSQEEGFHSILSSVGDFFTRALISKYYDDLEMRWVGLDSQTEERETQMLAQQMLWSKVGEIRAKTAILPPLDGPDKDMDDRILNPQILQYRQLELSEKQLAAQQEMQQQQLKLQQQEAEAAPTAGGRLHNNRPRQSPVKPKANSSG